MLKSIFVKWPPELEVGRTYRRRDGREEKITEHVPTSRFPYRTSTGEGYLPNGQYLIGHVDDGDIVEVAEQPTVEVGKWYRRNDGAVVQIKSGPDEDGEYESSDYSYYLPSGAYSGEEDDPNCPEHLVEEVDEPKPKLQLEVGKWYRRNDGEVVECVSHREPSRYFKVCSAAREGAKHWNYREDGTYVGRRRDPNYRRHLVEEVDAPEPKKPALQLEVGCMYRTRGGDLVTIVRQDNDAVVWWFDDAAGECYMPDGTLWEDDESDGDLVELVETEGARVTSTAGLLSGGSDFKTHSFSDRVTLRHMSEIISPCGGYPLNRGVFLRPRGDTNPTNTNFYSRDEILAMFDTAADDEAAA